ncbi:class III poly(R)-hydroxyalkanoic acid synthase subunit PhaC [Serpentinicella sp. ANB-PHB4]|uniref:class III poly(R)-hydroxyalkanoic acid synthase subunit PhaC n=1 Tax=Serpentinicella sp. ANB-PHB4 TaxID=3074076 RepID=UPI00285FDD75|nr:class III poly(R)-hydroxyalkanoic acid synthase subunit PhaC [Serpentinicella sp. ANB-PHB4]MDR5658646.1 class III poly(R)-hydroxyalkanoic acid synthase subunit PhaC [Serpentinicella sp. ANB-PHB4]
MISNTAIDMEKTLNDMFDTQKKLIRGVDVLLNLEEPECGVTPKELVYSEDKMQLFHYKPLAKKVCKVPTLIVYALVNRQYMMDIQQDRSVIKNLLELGLDLYIIDWGYPTAHDKYLTLDDYINGYIDSAVEHIRKETGSDKVNIVGVCQGGTFSTIYSAMNPDKVKNLITMVTPIDFEAGAESEEALLFKWSKNMNVDNMVDTFGVLPGDFLNMGFNMLKPFQLMMDKYVGLIDNIDNPDVMANFMRMEKWIFDSPGQAGEAFRQFIKDLYQENKLVKGTLEIGGKKVDLKNIKMPLLTIYAEQDHLVPPAATKPLNDLVGSKDKELVSFPVGHIGMYVSSKSQKEIAPKMAEWIMKREK